MPTYAIGDIQGCHRAFERLLDRIAFDPNADRLWLVGDLVNRGPDSLAVLRWVHAHRKQVKVVLGNHDLHLLGVAEGERSLRRGDTLEEILQAPDRDRLLGWLRRRPLMHREDGWVMVHAGIHPDWSFDEAESLARKIEAWLRGPRMGELLRRGAHSRRRRALAAFTRMRMLCADGAPAFKYTGPPDAAPAGLVPWFRFPTARPPGETILFGHWASLGLYSEGDVIALDSGCVWGGKLTALRLEDLRVFQACCR